MTRLIGALVLCSALVACDSVDKPAATASYTPPETPGLHVGDRAPDAGLLTDRGTPVRLSSFYGDGATVVMFYRGGWCPYCNASLKEFRDYQSDFDEAGAKIVAITPEKPDLTAQTSEKNGLGYTVLSDAGMEAARAYDVLFDLDADTKSKYEGYGIDLAANNAAGTWQLPAPGTFVVDSKGEIVYAFADWDYTKRADPAEVLRAVRAAE